MEKNGVSKAKSAVSFTKKEAEKRERKDIKSAYMKALRKQSPDKMIAVLAIVLASAPVVLQLIMDKKDAK